MFKVTLVPLCYIKSFYTDIILEENKIAKHTVVCMSTFKNFKVPCEKSSIVFFLL